MITFLAYIPITDGRKSLQANEMEVFKRFRVRAYPFLPCKQFLFLTWQSATWALQRRR